MKLSAIPLALIIVVILFGSIIFTTALNWWQTESNKIPAKFTEGEAAGQFNPADIRGSYTFQDIEDNFKVPVADLTTAFNLADLEDPGGFTVKGLEEMYAEQAAAGLEVGTTSVRFFVALYAQLPFEVIEDIFLPEPAVAILKSKGVLTSEQAAYLDAHSVPVDNAPAGNEPTVEDPKIIQGESTTESGEATLIKGKTTFQDLLDMGLNQAAIEATIGGTMPQIGIKIKDYCADNNLDFETVKLALEAELAKLSP